MQLQKSPLLCVMGISWQKQYSHIDFLIVEQNSFAPMASTYSFQGSTTAEKESGLLIL